MTKKDFSAFNRTFLLTCILLFSSFSVFAQTEQLINETLDAAAERYVKLGLELGEYDLDYVDAYLGPVEWRNKAQQKPRSKEQLAKDIHSLFTALKVMPINGEEPALRHKALFRNVRAMDVRARMLVGEKFSFSEEAKLIYDVQVPTYDFAKFDAALQQIAQLLPGEGDLSQRVEDFRNKFTIDEDKVDTVLGLAIQECRARSNTYIRLPDNENFKLEYVTDKNWSGYNWYQGANTSLMQINQDFPMQIDRAISLGCHEGYPGHHVWNTLIENKLLKQKGWIEYSLFPLFSPYALIAEGSANFGVELAFPNNQKIKFEKEVLFPAAGIPAESAVKLEKLIQLTDTLSHSITATAQLYLNGEITREQAIEQRRKYSLVSKDKAEQSIRFIEQYRAYVLNYNLGKDIVSHYVYAQGADQKSHWQAFERMLTELSTGSDMHK
ncbi:hypothetical protein RS130_10370 [Paraglaciecola aquimarina]|uniref:DUF885 domain-containing protein n=1 Tax=Paraglaciecola aquimarina TaxID=1235557 RepID=A0ABU3SWI8_9ALTE|nr:hypothetical protein [Paraglaciecola aquimarina]MDU0354282.1 hypothetical protein [Paraglaciecola aquimarina]